MVHAGPLDTDYARDRAIRAYVGDRIAAYSGYPASFCHGHVSLTDGLGLTPQQVQSVVATIAAEATTDAEYDPSGALTAGDLNRWVSAPPASWAPMTSLAAPASLKVALVQTSAALQTTSRRGVDPCVVTGISLDCPRMDRVFSEDAFEKLVRGETCIRRFQTNTSSVCWTRTSFVSSRTRRLGQHGSAKVFGDIPQLAGLKGAFDLAEEFGIDPKAILAWDISTQLAVAAGLLALRDAGIPLHAG